jgi:hypothetical protein
VSPQYLQSVGTPSSVQWLDMSVPQQYRESAETLSSVQWLNEACYHSTSGQQEHCLVFSDWIMSAPQ